jgi:hypothetical protein
MIDRRWLYGGGIAILGIGACFGIRNMLSGDGDGQSEEQKNASPRPAEEVTIKRGDLIEQTLTNQPEYKIYPLLDYPVYYKIVPDPLIQGRECVVLGEFDSPDGPHTLFGATTSLGDPSVYFDVEGTIYASDGTAIGSFENSRLPEWSDAPGINSESVVCANN